MSLANYNEDTLDTVKEYYGKTIQKTEDLEVQSCKKLPTKLPHFVTDALSLLADEVRSRYYGCGLILPEVLEGKSILDLGSGAGRDCFMLSKLVGENGSVTGIDMTDEQLEIANRYHEYHREKFGYSKANTTFVKGYIERLIEAGLEENFFDIIVSNCVICLSPDKKAVLQEAYKVLKDGGEVYFSNMYADRKMLDDNKNKVLWGEGFAGALYWKDLFTIAKEIGFSTPRLFTAELMDTPDKPGLKSLLGDAKFVAGTYRLFKLPRDTSADKCEVVYTGGIHGSEEEFKLDHLWTFQKGERKRVDGETAAILLNTRFGKYFRRGDNENTQEDAWVNPFNCVLQNGSAERCHLK